MLARSASRQPTAVVSRGKRTTNASEARDHISPEAHFRVSKPVNLSAPYIILSAGW